MIFQRRLSKLAMSGLLFAGVFCLSGLAQATWTLSDFPLFISTDGVKPNMILTIDDSGSMDAASVPEAIDSSYTSKRFKAATYNALYYDPNITYTPPPKYDGTTCSINSDLPGCWPNVSFNSAPVNGFVPNTLVDLSNAYKASRSYRVATNSNTRETTNPMNYTPGPTTYSGSGCNVTFTNSGTSDYIQINAGACDTVMSNLAAGATVTVTCPSGCGGRNGTYTVASGHPTGPEQTAKRIVVGSKWSSTVGPYANVGISWSNPAGAAVDPAYYYLFYTKAGVSQPAGCTGTTDTNNDACYVGVVVGFNPAPAGAPAGTVADKFSGNSAQQRQNFANWYSYYRIRTFALSSGIMRAMATIDSEVRIGWQSFNTCASLPTDGTNATCRGWNYSTTNKNYDNRLRRLSSTTGTGGSLRTHKQDLYDYLAFVSNTGGTGTELRLSSEKAGEFYSYSGTDKYSPYAEDPYYTQGVFYSCRRNVHVLLTDGYWNDSGNAKTANYNSNAVTVPTGPAGVTSYAWTPGYPYSDTNSGDLADIAFYYWSHDLSTLPNTLTPFYRDTSGTATANWLNPKNDPATWQHMQTYAMGLGLSSSLTTPVWGGSTYAGDYTKLASGLLSWPATGSDSANDVYDLWHAAISGRGQFFSAESPQQIVSGLQSIVSDVTGVTAAAAALAANSTSLNTGSVVFQAQFNSVDWSGHLYSFPVTGEGKVVDINSDNKLDGADASWDAATLIPTAGLRNILTRKSSGGTSFLWDNLDPSQQDALKTSIGDTLGSDRLDWLRGNSSKEERNGGTFRNRSSTVLGDIINSNPIFTKDENFGYASLPTGVEQSSYAAYVTTKGARVPMVYVGANDGMLHGFRADKGEPTSGVEMFAYVPAGVFGNLRSLTDPLYSHKYFVDGPPTVGDAYFDGGWKTVLVGGLGAGGKSIYALDVSDPANMLASKVLWEVSNATAGFEELGLTYSQPQIARLNSGDWVAIFGNGYNSTSDQASLFVVNLQTGALIRRIDTNSDTSNGLSTPVLYDSNNDKIVDVVYAGDLKGHIWKFDLSSPTSGSWSASELFQAKIGGTTQPITTQPKVGGHPLGGVMVYFGTGEYISTAATNDTSRQSFYGIWDDGSSINGRTSLVEQTIVAETNEFGSSVRETSNNIVDYAGGKRGWYMDLVPPLGPNGERVVSAPLLFSDRVIFVTLIPSASDKCVPGGTSWLMELESLMGGQPTTSYFDLNKDNSFTTGDFLASGKPATGVKLEIGIGTTPVIFKRDDGNFDKVISGSSTLIETVRNRDTKPPTPGTGGRVYWRQIY